MKTLFAMVVVMIAFAVQTMAQDSPQTQPPKVKPGLNLMGEKYVDPRVKEYRKAVDREYDAALKKIPDQKKTNSDSWAGVRSGEPAKK